MTTIHTLVFAHPEEGPWGAFWLPVQAGSAPLAYRLGGEPRVVAAELEETGSAGAWRLEGEGVSLIFTASAPAVASGAADARLHSVADRGLGSHDQLCAVSGTVLADATQREIDCLGWYARIDDGDSVDLAKIDTFRQTYGWFGPEDGLALAAFRPRKSRGQDADVVAAVVVDPDPAAAISEPRLSSTYDADGCPVRVGLELWFETEDSDDGDEPVPPREILRRAAGESIGPALQWKAGDFSIRAVAVRWHSRGSDGCGVYLLGQRG